MRNQLLRRASQPPESFQLKPDGSERISQALLEKFRAAKFVFGLAILIVGLSAIFPSPVQARFKFCNETKYDNIFIAFGYKKLNKGWYAEGWWKIGQNQCATVYGYPLRSRHYYYYAYSQDPNYPRTYWRGGEDSSSFCVNPSKQFELADSSTCSHTRSFRYVNVGRNLRYTITLS